MDRLNGTLSDGILTVMNRQRAKREWKKVKGAGLKVNKLIGFI
jgi:hypothetical protein